MAAAVAGFDVAETAWLNDTLCVYQPATNAMALLDGAAAEAWSAHAESASAGDRVQSDDRLDTHSAVFKQDWLSAGLIWPGGVSARTCLDGARGALGVSDVSVRGEACVHALALASSDQRILRVTTSCEHFYTAVRAVLAPFLVTDGSCMRTQVEGSLAVARINGSSFLVKRDGQAVSSPVDFASARHAVLRNAMLHLWPAQLLGGSIHGACLEREGRGVVLAGLSGAGKSTLAAAAVAAGWRYLGDDLLPVLKADGRVGQFATPISLKDGAAAVLGDLVPGVADLDRVSVGVRSAHYLPVSPQQLGSRCVQVAAIVFPERVAHGAAGDALRAIPAPEVMARLIASGSGPDGRPPSIAGLLQLVCQARGFVLQVDDVSTAVSRLQEVLDP